MAHTEHVEDAHPRDAGDPVEDADPLESAPLTFVLGAAFQAVVSGFVERLNEVGYSDLRPIHGLVFQAVSGEGMTSTELAVVLGVTKQAAGQMVGDLVEKGYLRREEHPDGGRRRLVVLTEQGLQHMAVAGMLLHELEVGVARQLGDPDLKVLRRGLVRVVRTLHPDGLPPLRPVW